MDEKILKTAYELAYGENLTESLTPEELNEAQRLAYSICCPTCGE